MSTLYIVATPIGNLEDITLRALRILREVDFILAEDTRVTKKLLEHYKIEKPLISYHQHSSQNKVEQIINLLKQGKNLALVSDAGTPGINDPGGKLIEVIVRGVGDVENVKIVPIPGPNAAISALSISGLRTDKFVYLGFPPAKNKRKKYFQNLTTWVTKEKMTVVFYESPHRILKTLHELAEVEILKNRPIVVGRELTKMYETVYRGTIENIIIPDQELKGEFVVIVNPFL
ncbi:MAG: 16S rRNA (cytidine(1402)-2'-O)-methyltransferase [Parcubacteria group bacterium]|nr:16S rRNA (cytidine(1402)-2'-O)-methyltransferase [Parcubacteria group bacterium]